MTLRELRILGADGLDALIRLIAARGWEPWGPVVRDGAILPGRISGLADLPTGWHDDQDAGRYRIRQEGDDEVFGWAVGPGSWKRAFLPPSQTVWEASGEPDSPAVTEAAPRPTLPIALVGVRPCDVSALGVLDVVLLKGAVPDPAFRGARENALVVTVECSKPAATCFCASMGTGPAGGEGADMIVTELGDGTGTGHRFLARPGSERGADLLGSVPSRRATAGDLAERELLMARAASGQRRRIDASGVPALLERNVDNPRWSTVAERCLSCGNCTLVCPTCFCTDVRDTSDLHGRLTRTRTWSSCFDLEHSYVHGGPVRQSRSSRYRQWILHKLSTWHSQFGSSGCVGCGRCIAWCPVGIDITAEVAAIAASEPVRPGSRPRGVVR